MPRCLEDCPEWLIDLPFALLASASESGFLQAARPFALAVLTAQNPSRTRSAARQARESL